MWKELDEKVLAQDALKDKGKESVGRQGKDGWDNIKYGESREQFLE